MITRPAAGLCAAALLLSFSSEALAVDQGAPAAPPDSIHDTYHGVTVADPYRWLENGDDTRVIAWEQAENARARAALDALPARPAIAARLKSLYGGASPSWRFLRMQGGHVFALVTAPPKQQPMVAVLDPDLDLAHQRIVIDPNTIDPTGQTTIDWFVPSPDGTLVAASISHNGSEDGTVHVFRVADGHETGDVVPRAQFPTGGGSLAWASDGHGFWVTRYPGTERPRPTATSTSRSSFTRSARRPRPTAPCSAATSPRWPRSSSTIAATRTSCSCRSRTATAANMSTSRSGATAQSTR